MREFLVVIANGAVFIVMVIAVVIVVCLATAGCDRLEQLE
jgi:hypothetical protein